MKIKHPLIAFVISSISTGAFASNVQTAFIQKMTPLIQQANQAILAKRERLLALYAETSAKQITLSVENIAWLNNLAANYQVANFSQADPSAWLKLFKRVDTLPTALVLAQAINESNWGRSRFATKANNYFGQWCYTQGCGMIPTQRPKNDIYEVQKFENVSSSIKAYLLNINTNPRYRALRNTRFAERLSGGKISAYKLAAGLSAYSQERGAYVKRIQTIILNFLAKIKRP